LRTRTLPTLRRVLYRPGAPFGPPPWVDDPAVAIEQHVHGARIAAPGGHGEVLRASEDLMAIEILGVLFDLTPDAPDPATAPPAPHPAPGRRALAAAWQWSGSVWRRRAPRRPRPRCDGQRRGPDAFGRRPP
jgi:hypothetical protein